ncbi:MAG: hypothetical protein ABF913_04820 [Oenococcus sp.]|uniref:hypothetical protein n=1 Tax=Oenococcus sp. TaxID=1979414 RepID=UPI0039E9A1EE
MTAKKDNQGKIIPAPKHKRGAHEKYPDGDERTKLLNDVSLMSARGATKENISAYIGINKTTFYEWCRKHPELSNAYEEGREKGILAIKGLIYEEAIGVQLRHPKTGQLLHYMNGEPMRDTPSQRMQLYYLSHFAPDMQSSKSALELAQARQIELQNELIKSQAELAKAKADLAKMEVENAKKQSENQDQQINIVDRWADED